MKSRAPRSDIVFVFDWDGVIFNVPKLRNAIVSHMLRNGLPRGIYRSTSEHARDGHGQYDPYIHGKIIEKRTGIVRKAIAQIIFAAIADTRDFIYLDARKLLREMTAAKLTIDVLTAGHTELQEYKIAKSDLHKLFRNVHVVRSGSATGPNKAKVLKQIAAKHDKVFFFDDRIGTIEEVHHSRALRGKVFPVLIDRRRKYSRHGLDFPVLSRLSYARIKELAGI